MTKVTRRNLLRLVGGAGALPLVLVTTDDIKAENIELEGENRHILHVTVGNVEWSPTVDEMKELATYFSEALRDPKGAVMVTRDGVVANLITIPLHVPRTT